MKNKIKLLAIISFLSLALVYITRWLTNGKIEEFFHDLSDDISEDF